MDSTKLPVSLAEKYAQAARDYLRRLSPEHFMEATAQGKQREITLESLALVHARRPEVQVFNELLVQYPRPGRRPIGQVVPDNMVVICHEPIQANGSFALHEQPARPFWVLEYVSKYTQRKDYEDNFERYENELKVPYFLLFYPDTRDLSLYRHTGEKYVSVPANAQGRHPLPELDLEVALLDGWVRFWFRGDLLPLPADLQAELDQLRAQLQAKDAQLQAKDRQLQAKDAQLQAKGAQLQAKDAELARILDHYRQQVEQRARRQGREDILAKLPGATDPELLSQWLDELG